jgi:hypothetical protein
MKRKRTYTDEPLGRLKVVEDFLPPPEKLVLREDGVKVMIRTLLNSYAERFSKRTR